MDTTSFSENAGGLGDSVRDKVEGDKRPSSRFSGWMSSFVDNHPATCVLGGLALGYLVARFARRRP